MTAPEWTFLFPKGEAGKKEGVTSSKEVQNLARQIPLDPKVGKESSFISYSVFQASNSSRWGSYPPSLCRAVPGPKPPAFSLLKPRK